MLLFPPAFDDALNGADKRVYPGQVGILVVLKVLSFTLIGGIFAFKICIVATETLHLHLIVTNFNIEVVAVRTLIGIIAIGMADNLIICVILLLVLSSVHGANNESLRARRNFIGEFEQLG